MALELGTEEVSKLLGMSLTHVQRLAVEVDVTDARAVRAVLRDKRLPGRKVGRVWLFLVGHVAQFRRIERPVGRPRKSRAA